MSRPPFRFAILAIGIGAAATPALAVDPCLVGVWRADGTDMATLLAAQMNGSARYVGGDVVMTIGADDSLIFQVLELQFEMQPEGAPFTQVVTVNGTSQGRFETGVSAESGGAFWDFTVGYYDFVGSAEVMGETMTIPFQSSSGMMGSADGTYQCTGDTAAFGAARAPMSFPRVWSRLR